MLLGSYASPPSAPSVTGEVYCFPHYQLILSIDGRVVFHLKGLWEYIPKSILSVWLSVRLSVPRSLNELLAGLHFYPKSFLLYINNKLYKLMDFFFKFRIHFQLSGRKPKIFQMKAEAWILIKLQCIIYQWIRLNELYKLMKRFLQISNYFSTFSPKTENYLKE